MVPQLLIDSGPYAVVALLAGGAMLLMRLQGKRAQEHFEARWTQRQQLIHSEVGSLRSTIQELRARVAEAERRAESLVSPQAPRAGMNISQRAQAIRLIRRGDRPDQIAAAVGMNAGEVELLGRIHRMTSSVDSVPSRSVREDDARANPPI
jgi:hypothetical protein